MERCDIPDNSKLTIIRHPKDESQSLMVIVKREGRVRYFRDLRISFINRETSRLIIASEQGGILRIPLKGIEHLEFRTGKVA